MLKVLLADDEKSILLGMKRIINWQEYGFEVAATAKNGAEVLEILKTTHVDLLITDIKMPGMSGLELIEKVKESNTDIKTILLSAYGEFQYAKKAMELKAEGYLLKPVDEEELIKLLLKTKKEREERIFHKKEQQHNFLRGLIEDNGTALGVSADGRFNFNDEGDWHYIVIELDNPENVFCAVDRSKAYEAKVYQSIKTYIGEENYWRILRESTSRFGIAISGQMSSGKDTGVVDYIDRMQKEMSANVGRTVSIMVGQRVNSVYEIKRSKKSINLCEAVRFYTDGGTIIYYEAVQERRFCDMEADQPLKDKLVKAVQDLSRTEAENAADVFCAMMKEMSILPNSVRTRVDINLLEIIKIVANIGADTTRLLSQYHLFHKAEGITINSVNIFLREFIAATFQAIEEQNQKSSTEVVDGIIGYLKENYRTEINLDYFAKIYFLNTNYLGQIFKRKTGTTFKKYLTVLRVDESKKLLGNTDVAISEIAERVGFNDANYFCTKFAELEGISPGRYRAKMKSE